MELEELLNKAHAVVIWTGQDTIRQDSAGARHLNAARKEYLRARADYYAAQRALTPADTGGCTCNTHQPGPSQCLYHYAAQLQPSNHRIPWNCPTYYDGCNCGENQE